MKTNFKWLVLSGILVCYAVLYMASSGWNEGGVLPACDEVCEKLQTVGGKLFANSSGTLMTEKCHTAQFCVTVNDSTNTNWNILADSACSYMKEEGLLNYTVNVIGYYSHDTLLTKPCP